MGNTERERGNHGGPLALSYNLKSLNPTISLVWKLLTQRLFLCVCVSVYVGGVKWQRSSPVNPIQRGNTLPLGAGTSPHLSPTVLQHPRTTASSEGCAVNEWPYYMSVRIYCMGKLWVPKPSTKAPFPDALQKYHFLIA